jgi:hypothetical protein
MDPGLYIQPTVVRIVAAIMRNRRVVDDRSASQRPPQDPLERYVLDVASTSWKQTVAGINDPTFLLLVNACKSPLYLSPLTQFPPTNIYCIYTAYCS